LTWLFADFNDRAQPWCCLQQGHYLVIKYLRSHPDCRAAPTAIALELDRNRVLNGKARTIGGLKNADALSRPDEVGAVGEIYDSEAVS